KSFRQESKFSTWLYSIMVNHCKNYRKKMNRYSTVSLKVMRGEDEVDLQLQDHRENPEEKVVNEDSIRIIKEEIEKLPPQPGWRLALSLSGIENTIPEEEQGGEGRPQAPKLPHATTAGDPLTSSAPVRNIGLDV
ncbi:MAG: sigma-70 family RNA polymerase sigma factor, partial [Chloroflexota bacterium]